ncbi:MAG: DUF5908 family protein [Flavobacteriaceae bacterium]|nr:DUF5908 family protein [Flavobacteriaceae bacterium]
MPVEIRELVIKAKIGNEESSGTASSGNGNEKQEVAINEIVEKVLQIIKEKLER